MYEYTRFKRGADQAMIMARPFHTHELNPPPHFYAPIDANTAGWVGDQTHDWIGLQAALKDMFISAAAGYATVGSDIGGYNGDSEISKQLLLRWTQLGAMLPIMENGGLKEHRPWAFDDETVNIYRYYAKLHHQLVPYLYSYNIDAHQSGISIVRPVGTGDENNTGNWENDWRYFLGDDIFVAPIYNDQNSRSIQFPDGQWVDFWNENQSYQGGDNVNYNVTLDKYPIFIRQGAIIPMNVEDAITGHGSTASDGNLTFLIYPKDQSQFTFHKSPSTSIDIETLEQAEGVTIQVGSSTDDYIFRVKRETEISYVSTDADGLLDQQISYSDFEAAPTGWYDDASSGITWIKLSTSGNAITINMTKNTSGTTSTSLGKKVANTDNADAMYSLHMQTDPPDLFKIDGSGQYQNGTSKTINPVPEIVEQNGQKYRFKGWLVNSQPVTGDSILVKMDSSHTVIADYEAVYHVNGEVLLYNERLPNTKLILTGSSIDTFYTDQTGSYSIDELPDGDYYLTPYKEGFKFQPAFRHIRYLDSLRIDYNFTAHDTLSPKVMVHTPNGGGNL